MAGIIKSPFRDVVIPNMSLEEFVMEEFDRYGDCVAMVDAVKGYHYTFKQVKRLVNKIHFGLVDQGLKQGDVFAIVSPNCPEFVLVVLGVVRAGGAVTTVNPACTVGELVHQLSNSEARYVITSPALASKALEARKRLPNLKEVYVFGEHPECNPYHSLLTNNGGSLPRSKVKYQEDVVFILYSSGTTGLPKGVMLTHRNVIATICQCKSDNFFKMNAETDCVLALLPLYHIFGLSIISMMSLREGVKMVMLPQFQPETFLSSIQDNKITVLYLVPPLMLFLAKNPLVDDYDLTSVRWIICGAAPLSRELMEAISERLNIRHIFQGYGLTEAAASVVVPNNVIVYGPSGLLLPSTEMKIVDVDTGRPLSGAGQKGEIWIRGPQVMKGYLKNREATERTIDKDGFLHSGDIGHVDKNGHLWVVDRLKELIKYKAYQVPPAELEALLLTNPDVLDAAVIGVPNEAAGELPRAYVVRKTTELTEEQVEKFVKENTSPHKWLRGGVVFVDEIPKSGSGKILRRELRKRIKSSL